MKTVVICGSKRFKKEMRTFAKELKNSGAVVFEPYLLLNEKEWQPLSDQYKKLILLGLTHDHFYRIKTADVVYVFNKDGYSGVSTTLELGYAIALGKTIYALSEDKEEGCRNVLFREIVKTPEKLIEKLR